jgi:hypothetical protein
MIPTLLIITNISSSSSLIGWWAIMSRSPYV